MVTQKVAIFIGSMTTPNITFARGFARGSRHYESHTPILTGIVKMQFAIGTRWRDSQSPEEFEVIAHELPYFIAMRTTHDEYYTMPDLTSGRFSEITPTAIPRKSRKGAR